MTLPGLISQQSILQDGDGLPVPDSMEFLVEHGPGQGLFLNASSSIAPGVPWENLKALIDGFAYYRRCGRT